MKIITNKNDLITAAIAGRTVFEQTIRSIPEDKMELTGVTGSWSVKDIIAHITAWEQQMQGWFDRIMQGTTADQLLTGLDGIDKVNERIYLENKQNPLQSILSDFHLRRAGFFDYLQSLDDETLFNIKKYSFEKDKPLWHLVAANTFWHYAEHLVDLEKLTI